MKLSNDSAIKDHDGDFLGFAPFSKSLATSIQNLDAQEGFVIGLTGEWGSGKTSALNLLRLEIEKNTAFTIVDFSPWLYSGREDLISAFFNVMAENGAKSEKTGKKIKKLFANIALSLRPVAETASLAVPSGLGALLGAGLLGVAQKSYLFALIGAFFGVFLGKGFKGLQ